MCYVMKYLPAGMMVVNAILDEALGFRLVASLRSCLAAICPNWLWWLTLMLSLTGWQKFGDL